MVAETQLRRGKQAIDDHVIGAHPVIDELRRLPFWADDEQWWHLALGNAAGKLDVDFFAVVECVQRPPGRLVALDGIAETEVPDVEAVDRCCAFGERILTA